MQKIEKLDLDSGWFTGYRLPADVYAFFEMPYEQDDCCFLIKNSMHFQSHFKVSVHNRTVR